MARGSLRIYLGAAPGVGKTYAMLNEGNRRAERGTDVVVAYLETHNRPNTGDQIGALEVLPRKQVTYRGTTLEEMDVDAVLARRPAVALVDELAHTNAPGSSHAKRWEDVEQLRDAGIDVITTLNIQHLESLNDVVERITGVRQKETIPDEVARSADQVELVDMAPEALRRRMAHGNIYAPEKVDAALANYFRVGNLGALRELALMWVADKVDEALQGYKAAHGITDAWETRERVVVAVTGAPSGAHLIRRASRMAMRSRGDLVGVHVIAGGGLALQSPELLPEHRRLLEDLGGAYREVVGDDVAESLTALARAEGATQLVLGASRRSRWSELARGSVVNDVLRRAEGIDVHIIGVDPDDGERPAVGGLLPRSRRLPGVSRRRRQLGWGLAVAGLPLLTLVLTHLRGSLGLPSQMLLYLLLLVCVTASGGLGPALATAVIGSLCVNWFFTPPIHRFDIARGENALALAIFLAVGVLVSVLVAQAAARRAEAARSTAEADALAAAAVELVTDDDPLPTLLRRVRQTFGLEAVAVLHEGAGGWAVDGHVGLPELTRPDQGTAIDLGTGATLVLAGRRLTSDDRRLVHALGAQLLAALERRRLQEHAAGAALVAEADALRVALLRAVSHDLRSPLASIKASVTSLLQRDVEWTEEATLELLEVIDEEADRLDQLVANLLDMSRLQSGGLRFQLRPVGYEEVVPAALASISGPTDQVDLDLDETLPRVLADPALLERVVANLTTNAVAASPAEGRVRIEAGAVAGRVDLRVVDRGRGIRPEERDKVFEPFQRLGDSSGGGGVGLGLAVARGFVEAMGGELAIDDTPGGGVTMVVSLPEVAEP
jgi:two-component system sensor histidine kinase KdpD